MHYIACCNLGRRWRLELDTAVLHGALSDVVTACSEERALAEQAALCEGGSVRVATAR